MLPFPGSLVASIFCPVETVLLPFLPWRRNVKPKLRTIESSETNAVTKGMNEQVEFKLKEL